MSPSDPGRKKATGPFDPPDPKFVITTVGLFHTLELNMYCVHRPSLILHTNKYRPQTEALDESDIAASFAVLRAMRSPFLLFYNCGVEAGSSQGHKHLQLTPKPDKKFEMFLDNTPLPTSKSSVSLWLVSPANISQHDLTLSKTSRTKCGRSRFYRMILPKRYTRSIFFYWKRPQKRSHPSRQWLRTTS